MSFEDHTVREGSPESSFRQTARASRAMDIASQQNRANGAMVSDMADSYGHKAPEIGLDYNVLNSPSVSDVSPDNVSPARLRGSR